MVIILHIFLIFVYRLSETLILMHEEEPIKKEIYLSRLYRNELAYINRIMLYQDYNYGSNGELVILVDDDFPDFSTLNEKKIGELIFLYEHSGWKIRKEELNGTKEFLLVFS